MQTIKTFTQYPTDPFQKRIISEGDINHGIGDHLRKLIYSYTISEREKKGNTKNMTTLLYSHTEVQRT